MATEQKTDQAIAELLGLADSPELEALKSSKLKMEIKQLTAAAQREELALAAELDVERDRQAKNGFNRRLVIADEIMPVTVAAYTGALDHWGVRDPGLPIEIVIDSPGGDVMGTLAIYDTILRLRRNGHNVVTRGRGLVASGASILLQAGSERVMDANAQLMIHEIAYGTRGKSSDIADMVALTKRLEDRLLGIYAERSTLSKLQIARKWKKTDWWLSADEAVQFGFADRVE
jgi:ATP-dependent Clp endopeptidase proteolytic subunit ClpP